MELQTLLNIAIGFFMGILGFVLKRAVSIVDKITEDVKQIEIDMPTSYARKDEMKEGFVKLENILTRMFEKLDEKIDKR